MDYRKITIEDLSELAKIYAETFNSDPWYDKWTQKTAEKRLSQMINNGGFFGMVSYNEERIEYIASKGVKTAEEPSFVEEVLLPEEPDEILLNYNEIQKNSGFDLSPYYGKTVKKYVYPLEDDAETFATLYVFEEKVIAADIASHTEGWQRPIDGKGNMG